MIPGSASPLLLKSAAAAAGPVQIERSLRFNSSDSAYLSRTPAVAGNRKTWTWAGWVKRSALGSGLICLADAKTGANESPIMFNEGPQDTLSFYQYIGGFNWQLRTTQVFRDVGAWFHLVVAVDTTQATAANRIKIYLNGSEITTFAIASYPSQNSDTSYNSTNIHTIGAKAFINSYFDGYLADIHFIDGQALTPSSFTEVSATTGQLIPKAYAGTYTGNSFWLKFNDNSAATATTLGKDSFLLGNNWTPNNLSVTAGAGNDSLVDTPTSYGTDTGVGGEIRGNYCTWNPLQNGGLTLSNGNLDTTFSTAAWRTTVGTFGMSTGKWYWEFTCTVTQDPNNNTVLGVGKSNVYLTNMPGFSGGNGYVYVAESGFKWFNGSGVSYGAIWTIGDVIGIAFDADNGTLAFYKNGANQGTAYTGIASDVYFPVISMNGVCGGSINFGQRPFAYQTPGTNRPAATFKALCDTNLPAPLVALPNTLMDVLTWSGSGGNRSFSSLGFSPDFVWIKQRNAAYTVGHQIYDIVRGAGSLKQLDSSNTTAEGGGNTDQYGYLSSFDSNGFGLTVGSLDSDYVNKSGVTYVAWAWDAGTTTASNTQGSITSQVRANVSAGFSVITYTGTGTAGATVGHGLGVAPGMIITKSRSNTSEWVVYHMGLATPSSQRLELQSTAAVVSSASDWNYTNPSSTVVTLGTSYSGNFSGYTHVMYCFAPVVGYSSFGSYTGNGSADGSFIFLGFRPRWVLIKQSSASGEGWFLLDTARSPYNVSQEYLVPNASFSETSAYNIMDILSNGFKLRATGSVSSFNGSGATYIYAAFAENPFQYARAR